METLVDNNLIRVFYVFKRNFIDKSRIYIYDEYGGFDMECVSENLTVLSIVNDTGHTMRDIEITYDGLKYNIEILKIKKDYEKTVFLKIREEDGLVDVKMNYDEKSYLIYKNLDVKSEIKIRVKVSEDEKNECFVKSYFFIE